jgi:cation:H+ antiporter
MMFLELFGGLVYLLLAGDLLVRGAISLAKRAEIPPMVVGLTIVAFGTSAPELFVAVGAVLTGHPDLALGNVVGSNIANVLVVLGVPALIYPTLCNQPSIGRDTALVLGISLLFTALCFAGPLGRVQGGLLTVTLLLILVRQTRQASEGGLQGEAEEELQRVLGLPTRGPMIALFIGLGMLGLPLGAHLMLEGAVAVAELAGVPEAAIGLSVVALGTSLPELATTVVAALHRHSDLALGNVLGSNLFNLLAIMGVAAIVSPSPIPVPEGFLGFDLPVMIGAALALGYFTWIRGAITRSSGATLLGGYAAYIAVLF